MKVKSHSSGTCHGLCLFRSLSLTLSRSPQSESVSRPVSESKSESVSVSVSQFAAASLSVAARLDECCVNKTNSQRSLRAHASHTQELAGVPTWHLCLFSEIGGVLAQSRSPLRCARQAALIVVWHSGRPKILAHVVSSAAKLASAREPLQLSLGQERSVVSLLVVPRLVWVLWRRKKLAPQAGKACGC